MTSGNSSESFGGTASARPFVQAVAGISPPPVASFDTSRDRSELVPDQTDAHDHKPDDAAAGAQNHGGYAETEFTITVDGGCGFDGALLAVCIETDGTVIDRIEA